MIKTRWNLNVVNKRSSHILVRKLGLLPLIATVLANRGINSPEEAIKFLNCDLNDLHNPNNIIRNNIIFESISTPFF